MYRDVETNELWLANNIHLYANRSTTWLAWEILRQRCRDNREAGYFTTPAEMKKTLWSYAMKKAYRLKENYKVRMAWELAA